MSALEGQYSKLPHSLLYRALTLGLSGCEWDVLLLLVRWAYGFDREDCSASLSRLAAKSTHSRRQISRALQRLRDHDLIELIEAPTSTRAGLYRIVNQIGESE